MSFIPIISGQAISVNIFPMPPDRAGGEADFPCLLTRAGMARVRLEPSHFLLNFERLKRRLGTPIQLNQGVRLPFID